MIATMISGAMTASSTEATPAVAHAREPNSRAACRRSARAGAFSGEVDAGSPQKMRPMQRNLKRKSHDHDHSASLASAEAIGRVP